MAIRNSRIVAWTTSTSSTGMPAWICIRPAPARIAPNSAAANTIPIGLDRASSATAIESKPTVVPKLDVMEWVTPSTTPAPARPARPPERAMVNISRNLGRIPAYRAASGLAPTVRTSKPRVVRYSSHQIAATTRSATRIPRCPFRPSRIG